MSLFRSGIKSPMAGLESSVGTSVGLVSIAVWMSLMVLRFIAVKSMLVVRFSVSFSWVGSSVCGRGLL